MLRTARCLSMRRCLAARASRAAGGLGADRGRARIMLDQQAQRLAVPIALRIIGAEDRGGLLRLLGDTEREIAFDQPLERLGGVAGGLVFLGDLAEPKARGEPVARALVEPADLHLLAGEM